MHNINNKYVKGTENSDCHLTKQCMFAIITIIILSTILSKKVKSTHIKCH